MESNTSLERRGSLFFSSSLLDSVDNAGFSKDLRSPSPEHKILAEKKKDLPRYRTQSEAQYADTEVWCKFFLEIFVAAIEEKLQFSSI